MYIKKGDEYIYIKKSIWIPCVLLCIVLIVSLTIMCVNPFGPLNMSEFGKLKQGITMLEEEYYQDINMEKLLDGMLLGATFSLGDPYTTYMNAKEAQSFMESIDSDDYAGVGLYIATTEDDGVIVLEPIEGAPAHTAGIVAGDKIVAVDGVSTVGMSLDEVAAKMKGPEGTDVVISVIKAESGEKVDVTLTRAIVERKTVQAKMITDKTGYIRLTQFGVNTCGEFIESFNGLVNENMTHLVVDLRNNGGGYLEQAVSIADAFIQEGNIVYTVGKTGKKNEYKATPGKTKVPMVLLINGNSASASEVLVGALKDYGLATIVGEKSFGKGVTQVTRHFDDGSMMKITDSRYYTPNGVCIDHMGIEPDVVVEMDKEKYGRISELGIDEDEQLEKAVELLEQ